MNKTTEVFESKNSNYSSTSVERALKLAEEAFAEAEILSNSIPVDCDKVDKALAAIREALAEQSIVLNDPHPPHRLCECTACLEYWTPLPDCDAFAASGKVIGCAYCDNPLFAGTKCNNCGRVTLAEPVKQKPVGVVEPSEEWGVAGVLIAGLPIGTKLYAAPVDAKAIRAEALEEAAEWCEQGTGDAIQTETLKLLLQERGRIASVIRGLK